MSLCTEQECSIFGSMSGSMSIVGVQTSKIVCISIFLGILIISLQNLKIFIYISHEIYC